MCGRFVITANGQIVADTFDLDSIPEIPTRYNIAPGQPILAIRRGLRSHDDGLEANWFNWGLVPSWADSPNIAFKTINARSETARTLPAFREAYKYRRCIIPASGYFEWKNVGMGKATPHYLKRADDGLILMAGLWEHWMSPDGTEIESATILTRDSASNPAINAIHHRMPVVIDPASLPLWFENRTLRFDDYKRIVSRDFEDPFIVWPVSDAINKTVRDTPDLIERIPILEQGELF